MLSGSLTVGACDIVRSFWKLKIKVLVCSDATVVENHRSLERDSADLLLLMGCDMGEKLAMASVLLRIVVKQLTDQADIKPVHGLGVLLTMRLGQKSPTKLQPVALVDSVINVSSRLGRCPNFSAGRLHFELLHPNTQC